ncbi:MAG: ATP-binding protein [Planctomycetes bacterium]|nr:ATP-binding protein [Planctomycetota bacterium]
MDRPTPPPVCAPIQLSPRHAGLVPSECRGRPPVKARVIRSTLGPAIVTSNKSFESWTDVVPDAVVASAVLDRLVHHAHLVPNVGESYRMKDIKSRRKTSDKETKTA